MRLPLTPDDDLMAEGPETAQVTGTVSGLTVTPASLTIGDNDQIPTAIKLLLDKDTVGEGDGSVELQVTARLVGASARTEDTSVTVTTTNRTAMSGDDYTAAPQEITLSIPADQLRSQPATLELDLVDDDLHEGTEEFRLVGTNADPGLLVRPVDVSIEDNDTAPTRVNLSLDRDTVGEGDGQQVLKVTGTLDGNMRTVGTVVTLTARDGSATQSDYSALLGQLRIPSGGRTGTATVLLTPTNDNLDEGDETLEVEGDTGDPSLPVTSQQVTITDDDERGLSFSRTEMTVEEGGSGTYTVVLDSEPTAEVTVTIGGTTGTDVSVDPATLTFTASSWDTAQTVTVSAAEDDDTLDDDPVTLTHTATGGDYEGLSGGSVEVTIEETDTPVISVSDAKASEADGAVVFTVTPSMASSKQMTVDYATSDGTADVDDDYTETSGTLDFPAGSTASQTIRVPVNDDAVDEADEETFTLTLSGAVNAALDGGNPTLAVTGTITDDDARGVSCLP